jgi:hypothetical protein
MSAWLSKKRLLPEVVLKRSSKLACCEAREHHVHLLASDGKHRVIFPFLRGPLPVK